jgi:hypothetical protein
VEIVTDMDLLTRALVTNSECCILGAKESWADGRPDAPSTDHRVAVNSTRPTALVEITCVVKLDGIIEKTASVENPIAMRPVRKERVFGRLVLIVISESHPLRTDEAVTTVAIG